MRNADRDASVILTNASFAAMRLRAVLGPTAELLDETPRIVQNITVNSRGRIKVERLGKKDEWLADTMSVDQRYAVITTLASRSGGRTINGDRSTLAADLPEPYRGRVQAFVPPIAKAPWFTIRVPLDHALPIEDYIDRGTLRAWWAHGIEASLRLELSGTLCGNVNSGKSTGLNSLMELKSRFHGEYGVLGIQDRDELLLDTFEDSDILTFDVEQARFQGEAYFRYTYDPQDAVRDALRANKKLLVWSEVRERFSASGLADAQNTGSRGLWTTLHCNGVDRAPRRYRSLLTAALNGQRPSNDTIAEMMDVYVYMERDPETGERLVTELAAQRKTDENEFGLVIQHFPDACTPFRVDIARIGDAYSIRVPALPEIGSKGDANGFASAQDAIDEADDIVQRAAALRWWKETLPASDVPAGGDVIHFV